MIPNEGMVIGEGAERGELRVRVNVRFPHREFTEEEREGNICVYVGGGQ